MKSSNVGGQAVMEGIMMRNGDKYAVAVRKENQEIEVKAETYTGFIKNRKLLKLPFIRGAFNFIDSMVLGMKSLNYSASFFMEEEEKEQEKKRSERNKNIMMGLTMVFSIVLSIGLFMILPYALASLLRQLTTSAAIVAIAEGILRLALFIGYIALISQMKDIRRVFMYHGAEHKCINCIEHGYELTIENVMKSSKQHKRCGTSFLLFVMIISIILFFFIRVESPLWRVLVRVLLMPVIAGISYEFIRLAGRTENKFIEFLSKPGLWMQELTTREPDVDMAEVAIRAVEAVFSWKDYLNENFGTNYDRTGEQK